MGSLMIDIIKILFEKRAADSSGFKEEDASERIQVATCALLLEVANSDSDFSDIEKDNIITILKKDFHLSDEYVTELMATSGRALKKSVDLWHFTNLINENYSIEEKIKVIEMLWKVIYADGKLDKYEDHLVHKLSNLLRLTHKQLIEAKIRVLHTN
jgi:uncharacterized tellurite resistance protein B-like protein